MRGVSRRQHVGLLGAGGHAGRRAGALHVEQHGGDLREVRQPQELAHQRQTRAAGGGEGAGAVPAGADHHADGRQLILRLHYGIVATPGTRVDAHPARVFFEGIHHRGRGCNGIPGSHGGTAVDSAQAQGGVAVEQDLVAHLVGALHPYAKGTFVVLPGVLVAQFQGLDIGQDQFFLALELVRHQFGQHPEIHIQQRRQGADIDHVLEQLTLPRVAVVLVTDTGQRQADEGDIPALQAQVQRLGIVVDEIPARLHLADVLGHALGVDREADVHPAAPPQVALFTDAHLVPGGQPLDIGGKNVLRADRQAHTK